LEHLPTDSAAIQTLGSTQTTQLLPDTSPNFLPTYRSSQL